MVKFNIALLFLVSSLVQAASVQFYVFDKEEPAKDIKIEVEANIVYTDQSGFAQLDLPDGNYLGKIYGNSKDYQTVKLKVRNDLPVFVNYTLLSTTHIQNIAPKINSQKSLSHTRIPFSAQVMSSKGEPISGVKVIVHGHSVEAQTDKNGEFSLNLARGIYSISFLHKDFSTRTLDSYELNEKAFEVIKMQASGYELEEFVVLAPSLKSSINALLEVRRSHETVADLIGSEQISKSGDSDAGSSLKRVTGLSLVDGKYVYVRGLGERYSSTLLNGAMISSADPSRRVVALDLFPAAIIENMTVQKGYSVDMPAEFGGGSIEIKTKSLANKNYFKFSISENFGAQGSLKTYDGGKQDWTGQDDGSRSIPSLLKSYLDSDTDISKLDAEKRRELAASIRKSYNVSELEAQESNSIPNFSIAAGGNTRLNKFKFGFNISSLYSNDWSFQSRQDNNYNQSSEGLVVDSEYTQERSKNTIKLGTMLGLGIDYKKNKIRYNGMLLRKTNDFVYEREGINSEKEQTRRTELGWSEKLTQGHQISGEHIVKSVNKMKINWLYSLNKAELSEPDNKMYLYIKDGEEYRIETENGSAGNTVAWRSMPEEMQNVRVDFSVPVSQDLIDNVEIKTGHFQMNRKRKFDSHTFYFRFQNSLLENSKTPDEVFSDSGAELYQQSNNTDNYSATQTINATYLNLLAKESDLDLNGGIRFETSNQVVESYKLFDAGKTTSELKTTDYLPAVSINYKISPSMQFRGSFSETISRPDLREISKTVWSDLEQGAQFRGNPNLTSAQITNYDLRYEWYFNRGELISLGYFQKDFKKPIEAVFGTLSDDGRVVGTTETQYTFINIDRAVNEGIEFEFRKKLPYFLTLGGNYSWINSQVEIDKNRAGQLTNLERPLQGQSPYLFNLQLDFETGEKQTVISILYNEMGRRITGVGADKRPDEYQEKISSLDFVASQKIQGNWKVKFKMKNILDPKIKRSQGDKVTREFKNGQQFSFALNGVF